MPFLNGKRVSNKEWREARGDAPADWKDAFGYNDGSEPAPDPEAEPVAEEPKPRRRGGRRKKAQADAVAAVTGLDISLDGDDEGSNSEESE